MPELPEVETARRLANRHIRSRNILKVFVDQDPIVFDRCSPRKCASLLKGRKVMATRRKGKHLWFELDRRPWPTFHFGMTGRFEIYQEAANRPRFCKIELLMDSGIRLAMTSKRRLGRIRVLESPEEEPPISRLGFDPYLGMPSPADFAARVTSRATPIKALLLDQGFAAGVGNWIADEILFQTGIDPRRRACDLSPEDIGSVRRAMRRIIRKAVDVGADADRFPNSWLFHVRWGRKSGVQTNRGEPVEFLDIGGRTTAWVPGRQS